MSSNILSYSIARELLEGEVGNDRFVMRAVSGGGRGRKGGGAEHNWVSYNVFRKEKDGPAGHTHGGPLPPGIYICKYVANHATFHECIYLQPTITAMFEVDARANVHFYNRDQFYIHGHGPHGSDGCIVPAMNSERIRLNKAIKNADGAVMLKVSELGMPLPAARETKTRTA
jgi:hypothetical protein